MLVVGPNGSIKKIIGKPPGSGFVLRIMRVMNVDAVKKV